MNIDTILIYFFLEYDASQFVMKFEFRLFLHLFLAIDQTLLIVKIKKITIFKFVSKINGFATRRIFI